MRQFFKFVLIAGGAVAALLVVLLAAAAIIIPIKYPPEKLKALAVGQLSSALKRNVSIGDVQFNIFSGFEITKLAVSNRPGWAPGNFLAADEISISYHLFPLLWGEVSLGQVELKNFNVFVEKRAGSQFNFSDMTASAPDVQALPAPAKPKTPLRKKAKPAKHKQAALPNEGVSTASTGFFLVSPAWAGTSDKAASSTALQLSVDSVKIVHGKMTYLDETTAPVQRSDLQDLNVTVKNISLAGAKTSFELDAPLVYNKKAYHLLVGGSFRYFMAAQTLKELQVKGSLNDLAFNVAGSAENLTDNFTPDIEGSASLDMLKFAGLIPNLSGMPSGLALTGPAGVSFHLDGDLNSGLKLAGKADASQLVLSYKDLFAKTAATTCTVEFTSVNQFSKGLFDVPSFKLTYDVWEVDGTFHYRDDGAFSGEVRSKALPFAGLSNMIPKLKRATFAGTGSVNLSFAKGGAKAAPLNLNGQILLKGIGVSLPDEPYLENLTGPINFTGNVIRASGITFNTFDGTGLAGVTFTIDPQTYSYSLALKNVDAQKTIDASIDAYVTTKDFSAYKDKLYGSLDLAYAGTGKGFSSDVMLANLKGAGNYTLAQARLKGFSVIKSVNQYFKQSSDEIDFNQVAGNLGMKNRVFSYTANCEGKVGVVRVNGAVDCQTLAYSPNMTIQCDLKKDFVNSDSVVAGLPGSLKGQVKNLDWLADSQGNIPVDLKFTGPASENHWSFDGGRLGKNIGKHIGDALTHGLGDKLKSLF
jgi:hypothetical protein